MRRKLFCCDGDIAFVPPGLGSMDGLIVEKNECDATTWRTRGHIFALATKRSPDDFTQIFPEWVMYADYLIACDGAVIVNGHKKHVCVDSSFKGRLAGQLDGALRSLALEQRFTIVGYDNTGKESLIEPNGNKESTVESDWCWAGLWFTSEKDCRTVERALAGDFGDKLNVATYYGSNWARRETTYQHLIAITKSGINRCTGAEAIRSEWRIAVDDVYVLGSGTRDIPMTNGRVSEYGRTCKQFNAFAVTRADGNLKKAVGEAHLVGEAYILLDKLLFPPKPTKKHLQLPL